MIYENEIENENLSKVFKEEFKKLLLINNVKNITQYEKVLRIFRKDKKFIAVGKFTDRYWIQRGWSKKEALEKKKQFKRTGLVSTMTTDFWTVKINPKTKHLYTIEEAKYKILSQRSINTEYWLEKGFNKEESIKKVSEVQKKNSQKFIDKLKKNPENYTDRTNTQIMYYVNKLNVSLEEAKKLLSIRQNVSSLKVLIEKYGDIEGQRKYEEICKNIGYSETINGYIDRCGEKEGTLKYNEYCEKLSFVKTLEGHIHKYGLKEGTKKHDKLLLDLSVSLSDFIIKHGLEKGTERYNTFCEKVRFYNTLEGYIEKYGIEEGPKKYDEKCSKISFNNTLNGFIENYGIEEGSQKYQQKLINFLGNSVGYSTSKESLIFFKPLYKKLRQFLTKEEIYWGITGSKEYYLWDTPNKKMFFYDLTIPKYKIIIEFHGIRYHPNPKWDFEKWNNWNFMNMNASEKRILDLHKNSVAIKKGYRVIEVFSDEKNLFDDNIVLDYIKTIINSKNI